MIGQGHVPSLDMVMMNLLLTLGSKDQQVGKKSRCYLSFFPLYIYIYINQAIGKFKNVKSPKASSEEVNLRSISPFIDC